MNIFQVGQIVCLRADNSRQGSIIEVIPSSDDQPRYRVYHSADDIREYFEDQLSLLPQLRSGLEPTSWLEVDEFQAGFTAARLFHPLTDNIYALHAARIQYIPFQFKPLLRLLRGDRPRLLIADEVGVGKTIEAGLILRELQSRQELENILIICPKALASKWRMEMRRFDEDFYVLSPETIKYCIRETDYDGEWPVKYSRTIGNLELLRNPDYLFGIQGRSPGLATLNPPPKFSLVIFDEAHHLRNPDTNSHQLARILCDVSEAVLFLSATPIQLGSGNLFVLLNLLRPDMFPDEHVFNEMAIPNRHLNDAIRHIRTRAPQETWRLKASEALETAAATTWGTHALASDPRFSDSFQCLRNSDEISDAGRIRCLRDLEEVHTLSSLMNRTRRRDIGRFTIREPHTVSVQFTGPQREFYDELMQFRRNVLALRYDAAVIRLILDMLERQASSCLLALVPTLDAFLRTGRFSASHITDAKEEGEEEEFPLPPDLAAHAQKLRDKAAALPPEDPKWEALLEIARATNESVGPGKILIFSFFLNTLSYLTRKLSSAGFRVALITGLVDDEEREELRARFRKPKADSNAVDILLSSEVGCEGLDYEFCDRMVNYDIPWNPMRLEQRIGRIDRFGQTAEKVMIFNFITPGTVEERIFFRCYERLGIFRDTIGDCEEVLGEFAVAEQLLELARNPQLTPEQVVEKAGQIADNALRRLEEQRRLEEEGSRLLGLDHGLIDEVDATENEGRFVSGNELRAMVDWFVSRPDLGGKIEADREHPGLCRLRLNRNARDTLASRFKSMNQPDRAMRLFRRWLEGTDPYLTVTFDQRAAAERRDIPFITPIHPLARLAVKELAAQSRPLALCVRCRDTRFPAGRYVFCCELWESIAIRPEIQLVSVAWYANEHRPAPELAECLLELLRNPDNRQVSEPDNATLEASLARLNGLLGDKRAKSLAELQKRNETLINYKLSSLEAHHQNRISRIETDLIAATDQRIKRMKESERARVAQDFERRRTEIDKRRLADIVTQRLAVGIVEIYHAV